jgi:CheY-like chemotaxis protein
MSRTRVLIVDDQPANLVAFQGVLAAADWDVLAVTSGPEALKALLQHTDIAVIILDVQMPGMDGPHLIDGCLAQAGLIMDG